MGVCFVTFISLIAIQGREREFRGKAASQFRLVQVRTGQGREVEFFCFVAHRSETLYFGMVQLSFSFFLPSFAFLYILTPHLYIQYTRNRRPEARRLQKGVDNRIRSAV